MGGQLSYAASLTLGLIIGRAFARRTGALAFLLAMPAAFCVIGGPFIHIQQIPAALPAALLLFSRFPAYRFSHGLSAFLLAIPWHHFSYLLLLMLPVFGITMLLSAQFLRAPFWAQASIGSAILGIVVSANMLFAPPTSAVMHLPAMKADALSEDIWSLYIQAHHTNNQLLFLFLQFPTWFALLLMAVTGIRSLGDKDDAKHANIA
jgi:hypothetical protein